MRVLALRAGAVACLGVGGAVGAALVAIAAGAVAIVCLGIDLWETASTLAEAQEVERLTLKYRSLDAQTRDAARELDAAKARAARSERGWIPRG